MTSVEFTQGLNQPTEAISGVFKAAFSDSEGAAEGALIADLAKALIDTTAPDDLYCFCAESRGTIIGSIFLSRLRYASTSADVFLLAPVAVATSRQGQGVGQALIRHGLEHLRRNGVDLVVTYGDPNYYHRVGFAPVSVEDVPSPQTLSYPHGWLAVHLSDAQILPLGGPVTAVPAFDKPELW